MSLRTILVLNGPNLDMLGVREPEVYGKTTLAQLEDEVRAYAEAEGIRAEFYQSNSEAKLIGKLHGAQGAFDGVVYNPGAHTHYSYALRDAVGSIDVPVVEVHLSDIDEREPFRRVSVIAPACVAQVKGLGHAGYCRAIDVLEAHPSLARLGEGYESRFDTSQPIIVSDPLPIPQPPAGEVPSDDGEDGRDAPNPEIARVVVEEAAESPDVAGFPEPDALDRLFGSADEPSGQATVQPAFPQPPATPARRVARETPVDYAAAFAGAVAAVDAGLLSFERQALVRGAYERMGLAALLVRDTSNIHWITGLDGVFDEERAHALLLSKGQAVLHTDSRYANALRQVAAKAGSDILVNEERTGHARFAAAALTQGGAAQFSGKLGIEDSITYAEFVKMVEAFTTAGLAPTTDLVVGLRAVKDPGEICRLRAAQAVTDAAFTHIIEFIRPGMTEREVQLELEDFMVRHGGEGLAFRSIVAAGANGADPHAVPGNTRLEAGQCVVLDFGAKAYGYCSDMTRTVFLGKPEGQMADAWHTLRRANETVEALIAPGVTGAQAHNTAERVLEEGGFGGKMGHGLGHGVGIDVHELPVLNPRNNAPLVAGNVVTVEPGIYLPGRFGMRLEDFGVVTDGGFDVFTRSTHEMVIL